MDFLAKVVNGISPCDAPVSTLQICFLRYVDDERISCGARMTNTYQVNMPTIDKFSKRASERYGNLKKRLKSVNDDMWIDGLTERDDNLSEGKAFIELEMWQYRIYTQILGKTAPYDSKNSNELTVYEWKLKSHICDAFIFNRIRFDTVAVIIENNMEHWFGVRTSSYPIFTYQRSRPRQRALMEFECRELPQSPIVLAASNPKYESKCDDCGECNQITMPMETYCFRRSCKNPTEKISNLENAEECTEIEKRKFNFKNIFKPKK